eukprot:SAG31_NODE_31148_length_371_cov_1.213235_1_plen_77_part_00
MEGMGTGQLVPQLFGGTKWKVGVMLWWCQRGFHDAGGVFLKGASMARRVDIASNVRGCRWSECADAQDDMMTLDVE